MQAYYSYRDYRQWLKDQFEFQKQKHAFWSHRYIAQKMGLSSVGWFGDILCGKRKLRIDQAQQLTQIFKWTTKESDFFELLVEFAHAKQPNVQNAVFHKMMSHVPSDSRLLADDHFAYFEGWLHAALRQHLLSHRFSGDFRQLQKAFRPSVSIAQLKESIDLLIRLGLVQFTAGKYDVVPGHLRKDPQTHFLGFFNYINSNAQISIEMLQKVPKEERDFSTLTLHLDAQGLAEAREEIAALRQKLRQLSESASQRKSPMVYQALLQLFPLTQEENK